MNLKVLIVEDDIASAMLLKLLIRNISNEVLTVKNGLEAVRVCQENGDIDLITMDLQIAGINGFETTRRIREFNKDVVIIAQSAYAMVHDKKKALSVGCNDFITKPIEKSEFMSLVNKYFQ